MSAQATEALAELCHDQACRDVAAEAGIIDVLVDLLSSEASGAVTAADGSLVDVRAAAATGLQNLALEEKLQDQIAARGASALVELCSTTDDISSAQVAADGHDEAASSLRRATAGAIWAIVMNNPANQTLFAQKDAVAPLVAMCSTHLPSTMVAAKFCSVLEYPSPLTTLSNTLSKLSCIISPKSIARSILAVRNIPMHEYI